MIANQLQKLQFIFFFISIWIFETKHKKWTGQTFNMNWKNFNNSIKAPPKEESTLIFHRFFKFYLQISSVLVAL